MGDSRSQWNLGMAEHSTVVQFHFSLWYLQVSALPSCCRRLRRMPTWWNGGMNGGEQEKWCHHSQLTGGYVWTTILDHVGCKLQESR
jgi:hypothetical protein